MDVMIRGRSPPDRKLASSLNTPTTANGPPRLAPDCDLSMISLPSASSSPNRRSWAVVLITTTRDADRDSCSVNMRPSTMLGGFTAGQLAVTPATCTLDSSLSRYLADALQPCWIRTSPTVSTRLSASASPNVSRGLERHLQVSPLSSQASNTMG